MSDSKKIMDVETAKAVIAHEAVECFSATEQKASTQPEHLTSCTGGIFWGRPGETWPVTADAKPLIPWLQIVYADVDAQRFHNRKTTCFYLREDFDDDEGTSAWDRSDFVVREFGPGDDLAPLVRPEGLERHPFHQVLWRKELDYPSLSKYYRLFDEATYQALCKIESFEYANRYGIKIGGWPTPVQRDQQYPCIYELQIDMTENYMYGDSGVGYLSRRGDRWNLMFECC